MSLPISPTRFWRRSGVSPRPGTGTSSTACLPYHSCVYTTCDLKSLFLVVSNCQPAVICSGMSFVCQVGVALALVWECMSTALGYIMAACGEVGVCKQYPTYFKYVSVPKYLCTM